MSTKAQASSGGTQGASGTEGQTQSTDQNSTDAGTPGSVAYESYAKVLKEKKKRDEDLAEMRKRMEELEGERKAREEAELKQKEDWKKMLELREKELVETKTKFGELQTSLQNGAKLRAFLDALGGAKVEEQYWGLVDLNQVVLDPVSGMPDEASAKKAAEEFGKKFPLVIQRSDAARLPNEAAQATGSLSYDEWVKMPLKEQKANLKRVMMS